MPVFPELQRQKQRRTLSEMDASDEQLSVSPGRIVENLCGKCGKLLKQMQDSSAQYPAPRERTDRRRESRRLSGQTGRACCPDRKIEALRRMPRFPCEEDPKPAPVISHRGSPRRLQSDAAVTFPVPGASATLPPERGSQAAVSP